MSATADQVEWCDLFDPFSLELLSEPHHIYRRLRETEPIHWSPPLKAWVMTRLEDVRAIAGDPDFEVLEASTLLRELGRRSQRSFDATIRFLDNTLFFASGEAHRRARRTVSKVMNGVSLSRLEPVAAEIADGLVERLPTDGRFDVVAAFADPFPHLVMAHILGIPQDDVPTLSVLLSETTRVFDTIDLVSLEAIERSMSSATALMAACIAKAPRHSGLAMIGADAHSADDAAALALFVYRVGSETTIGMSGLAFRALMDLPDVAARLTSDPSLIPVFISEVLRLESNVQRSIRVARVDKGVGGREIRAGERVMLLIGAANRDPSMFDDPDSLSFDPRPPDLAFGAGAHTCLGIALSRMEGRLAVERYLRWLPAVRNGREEWYLGRTIRRLTKLPVQVAPARC